MDKHDLVVMVLRYSAAEREKLARELMPVAMPTLCGHRHMSAWSVCPEHAAMPRPHPV